MDVDPTERFADVVAERDAMALDEACLLIAAHARPALDVAAERARLDELAAGLGPLPAEALVTQLCGPLGFAGAREDYHDPRSSLLPDVLDRRRGIPLALAVVALEVGRRIGTPLVGVGMPGHFLLGDPAQPDRYYDLFGGGTALDRAGCRALFERLHPAGAWDDGHLRPVGATAIVVRTLANLGNAYRRRGDRGAVAWTLALRLLLPGSTARERRELAVLLGALGRFDQAATVLEEVGSQEDLAAATRLRARLN